MIGAARSLLNPVGPGSRLLEFLQSDGTVGDAYLAMRGFFDRQACKTVASEYFKSHSDLTDIIRSVVKQVSSGVGNWAVPDQISYLELTRYMRNQLLRDSDVMSMAWSLELRVPFVDRRLFQSVSKIPAALRLAAGKQLLVDAVGQVPQWVIDQPKRGFRFPFQVWMESDPVWKQRFSEVLHKSPVKLDFWYQRWMLFVLEKTVESLALTAEAA